MMRSHNPIVGIGLAMLALGGVPIGRECPHPFADTSSNPRPLVDRDDDARLAAAEAKRRRKAAQRARPAATPEAGG